MKILATIGLCAGIVLVNSNGCDQTEEEREEIVEIVELRSEEDSPTNYVFPARVDQRLEFVDGFYLDGWYWRILQDKHTGKEWLVIYDFAQVNVVPYNSGDSLYTSFEPPEDDDDDSPMTPFIIE